MPRDLADVLHYFLPELDPASPRTGAREEVASAPAVGQSTRLSEAAPISAAPIQFPPNAPPTHARRNPGLTTLHVIAAPIGDQDVVRAALLWNLAVEVARHGGRALLLRPEPALVSSAWPPAGRGPMGVEVVLSPARNLGELYRSAVDMALLWAGEAPEGGLVFVQVPPAWLRSPGDGAALLRWTLLFTTCDPGDVRDAYGIAKLVLRGQPTAEIGITVHAARHRAEAEHTFAALARTAREHLGCRFESYGLLVDDLHVYRAVLAGRPIGLAHPQSLAARALHDVASLLLEDAHHLKPC